jgi:hypothetical protein
MLFPTLKRLSFISCFYTWCYKERHTANTIMPYTPVDTLYLADDRVEEDIAPEINALFREVLFISVEL